MTKLCLHSWDINPGTDGTEMVCSRCGEHAPTPQSILNALRRGEKLAHIDEAGDVYSRVAFMTAVPRDICKRVIVAFGYAGGSK